MNKIFMVDVGPFAARAAPAADSYSKSAESASPTQTYCSNGLA